GGHLCAGVEQRAGGLHRIEAVGIQGFELVPAAQVYQGQLVGTVVN
nr:hypothetical protein [Tanacetum cinerariifolium]